MVHTLVLDAGEIRNLLLYLRLKEDIAMKYVVDRLTQPQSEADKKEFIRGMLGTEKVNAGSFALGMVAGWLLMPRRNARR